MKNHIYIIFFLFTVIATAQEEFISSEIKINDLISGTLLTPSDKTEKLAILIPGSGPTDRNGNQQMMQNNSLKKLAEALSKEGIATFRYDKRIFSLAKQNALKEEDINFDDFVDDAEAVISFFKEKGYSDITLIGHSQGALVAELAAKDIAITKLVSLAGAGKSIDQLILDQLEKQAPALRENAEQAFNDLKKTGKAEKFSPGLFSFLRPSIQPFMLSWMLYDPAEVLKGLDIPILIITGSKDLQVPEGEGELLANANPDAEYIQIKNMNHVLKEIEGDDLENSKAYNESFRPVIPQLITEIADFIKK